MANGVKILQNEGQGLLYTLDFLLPPKDFSGYYISTDGPSSRLIVLGTYVVNVCPPIGINVKTRSSCADGTRHRSSIINFSRYLDPEYREVVASVMQRNAYFGHSENIILTMLADDGENVRRLAYRRNVAARKENADSTTIRLFHVPLPNFAANDYIDLVECQSIDRCQPPTTKYTWQTVSCRYTFKLVCLKRLTCLRSPDTLRLQSVAFDWLLRHQQQYVGLSGVRFSYMLGFARLKSRKVQKHFIKKSNIG